MMALEKWRGIGARIIALGPERRLSLDASIVGILFLFLEIVLLSVWRRPDVAASSLS